MPRHGKNNTASSFFTAYEKSQLEYGTVKQRLGADSLRSFDACGLCLKRVEEGRSCQKGHLFCKECIYENLLAQKKQIARQKKLFARQQEQATADADAAAEEEKQKEIEAFDALECGVLPTSSVATASDSVAPASSSKPKTSEKLAAFWLPSLTPEAVAQVVEKPSGVTRCPTGRHKMRLKQLTTVHFHEDEDGAFQCPVCIKKFTNASKAAIVGKCGHVVCASCLKDIVLPSGSCIECEGKISQSKVIHLESGGTGFAAHNKVEAQRVTPAAWV